jgi:hypothetical protein
VCMRFLLPPQELAAVDKAGEVHSSRPVVILGPLSWSARWGKVVVPPIWRATCQKLRSKLLSGIGAGCALCRGMAWDRRGMARGWRGVAWDRRGMGVGLPANFL